MEEKNMAEKIPQQCEYCQHFQKDEYTGYCQIHCAYVVKTFVCEKFALHYSFSKVR